MSKTRIPPNLRKQVEQDGKYRCGYCLTQQKVIGQPMTIDHIIAESQGGLTTRENLWTACVRCNLFKSGRATAFDTLSQQFVPLFNPRTQIWQNHFTWSQDRIQIIGTTAIGRATVTALKLNNQEVTASRRLWIQGGWHPPND